MKRIYPFLLVCALLSSLNATAQYLLQGFKIKSATTGFVSGYQKVASNGVNTKHQLRYSCRGTTSSLAIGSTLNSVANTDINGALGGYAANPVILLFNRDSSSKANRMKSTGNILTAYNVPYPVGQYMHLYHNACNGCADPGMEGRPETLNFTNEIISDTSITFTPEIPVYFTVDSAAAVGGITLFHAQFSILNDSAAYKLKNIISSYVNGIPFLIPHEESFGIFYSRIFRYSAGASINSPEATNRACIVALKSRPQTYRFGYVDQERDSISVTPLQMRVGKKVWHPSIDLSGVNLLTSAQQAAIKTGLIDSTQPLVYKPGFSPANPFGPGSSFALNAATGDITFTAPDTGIYFLAFRITEYRGGMPLGDIMTYRVAWVIDSTSVKLPTIGQPQNLTGATYDSVAGLMVICPGSTASFSIAAAGQIPGSQIALEHNFRQAAAGSTTLYTGHGTMAPQVAVTWQPAAADTGYHDVFVSALDTGCGTGHSLVPVSRGFRILVRGTLKARTADSLICAGALATLGIKPGFGAAPPYTWQVVPGGDPTALSCTACAAPTVRPSITTRYAVASVAGGCSQKDTITVQVRPKPVAGAISAILVSGSQYSFSAPASQNATTYSWLFGVGTQTGSGSIIIYSYPANGTFTARLIVSNACGADTSYKTIITGNGHNTAGIGNAVNRDEVSIYPNPASQSITIKMEQGSIKSYRIIAANGAVVKESKLSSNVKEVEVDISRLPPGIYTLQLQTGNGAVTRQIEISR